MPGSRSLRFKGQWSPPDTPSGLPGQGSAAESCMGWGCAPARGRTGGMTSSSSPLPRRGAGLTRTLGSGGFSPCVGPRLGHAVIRSPAPGGVPKGWFALGMAAVGKMRLGSRSFRAGGAGGVGQRNGVWGGAASHLGGGPGAHRAEAPPSPLGSSHPRSRLSCRLP